MATSVMIGLMNEGWKGVISHRRRMAKLPLAAVVMAMVLGAAAAAAPLPAWPVASAPAMEWTAKRKKLCRLAPPPHHTRESHPRLESPPLHQKPARACTPAGRWPTAQSDARLARQTGCSIPPPTSPPSVPPPCKGRLTTSTSPTKDASQHGQSRSPPLPAPASPTPHHRRRPSTGVMPLSYRAASSCSSASGSTYGGT